MTTGRYQEYPEYRDSGVEWLGQLPKHWEARRLKFSCQVFPSNVDKKSYEGETPVRLCNYTDVYYNEAITADMDFMAATASTAQIAKFTLRAGDTIITKDSETADDIAIAAYVPKDLPGVICGYHLSMVRPFDGFDGAFVKRLFDSTYAKSCFAVRANGLTRVGLGQYELDNVELPFPTFEEQTQIAKFLDHETAKIDRLIEKQRELIALLKEKRQAVISHAVTKGLNPAAPMKDSGIEWLGKVPAHWKVGRYKFCTTRVVVGIAEAATHAYAEEGTPIIRSTNITEEGLREEGILHIKPWFAEQNESKYLHAGDVVTVRTGYPGISAVVPQSLDRSQCFTNLVATPSSDMDSEFLSSFLNSNFGKEYFELTGWGSAQKNISVPILQNIPVTWPPPDEQLEIVAFVEKQRNKYTSLNTCAENTVTLLQERRTALISAAVTGKIDVRNWAPTEN